MKILFPYLARWHSANRSRYHQLLAHLCRLGHRVYALTAPPMAINDISANDILNGGEPLPPELTVSELYLPEKLHSFLRRPLPRTKMLKKGLVALTSIPQIRRFIEKEKIDLLLVYNLPQAPLLRLTLQAECRTHFDLADDLVAMMQVEDKFAAKVGLMTIARAVQEDMILRASTVTVASSVLQEKIKRPVVLLPNGADIAELDQADGRAWRARVKGPTVGFVGAFEYWVDFDLVLQTARRLPLVNFLLVGGGRQMKYLQRHIAQYGLKNFHLTGAVSYQDAMDYVAGMDVCILPFTHDAVSNGSCPLKIFEYAGLRKPIVSTCAQEVMRIGNGWISFADDIATFTGAIESFLSDQRAAERAGEAGRAIVERLYNWTNMARQFEDLLVNGATPGFEPALARRIVLETLESGFETTR
ncbi:MAG: glycosyltransferase [Blastocatellia bacterium]